MQDLAAPARRTVLASLAATGALALVRPLPALAQTRPILMRAIPSSGERLPAVGLGSWVTFNVGDDNIARDAVADVMRAFFASGGRLIDSSPMYGSSQEVIGYGLRKLGSAPVFAADKVWISSGRRGPAQIEESRRLWGVPRFDLLQVHNLLAWEAHLPTLRQMKEEGRLRYVGITTSEGRRHAEVERIMVGGEAIDFVQLTYNVLDREVEARLLPLAAERRIGVIVNRPFRQGGLIRKVERHPLPGWAAELGCASWAQLLLKFILAHPAVTCVIPATTRADHVVENVRSAAPPLPDAAMRRRIIAEVERL